MMPFSPPGIGSSIGWVAGIRLDFRRRGESPAHHLIHGGADEQRRAVFSDRAHLVGGFALVEMDETEERAGFADDRLAVEVEASGLGTGDVPFQHQQSVFIPPALAHRAAEAIAAGQRDHDAGFVGREDVPEEVARQGHGNLRRFFPVGDG